MFNLLLQKTVLRYATVAMLFGAACTHSYSSAANTTQQHAAKPTLAQEFLSKIRRGFSNAEHFMREAGITDGGVDLRGLPEGETLILEIELPPRLLVEGVVFGEIYDGTVLVSLNDFIQTLDLPIDYNDETKQFSGWFIRESKQFLLDLNTRDISSDGQQYQANDQTRFLEDDALVSLGDIGVWFDTAVEIDVGTQRLILDPTHPFPATERFLRREKDYARTGHDPPSLPLYEDEYDWISVPSIDVSTRSTYRRSDTQDTTRSHQANIRTAGEFAKGALTTNSSFTDEDQLTSARVTYLRESARNDLLGPLNARRFEAGDLTPTQLPITGSAPPETGVRITNADPLRNLTLPSTRIEGYFFPEWDIELYRDQSLLAFQETDEEGYYFFDNVPLFSERNSFRIVAYGPQGEVREESISIPYDRERVSDQGGVYDVSLTFQDRQFYRKVDSRDEDRNTPHFVGFYEVPVGNNSAVRVGGRYRQEDGEDKAYASAAISTAFQQALINAEIATDEQGELASQFSATRQFGKHRARVDLDLASDEFSPGSQRSSVQTLSNRYNFEGPLGLKIGDHPRYTANIQYSENSLDESNLNGFVNFNTQFGRIGLNQSLNYNDSSTSADGANIGGTTAVTGSFNKNLVRALGRYSFQPKSSLDSLTAFWKHTFNNELESQLQVDRTIEDSVTRYSAQVNWRPEFATITPRISYDTEGDVEATLNTRFSLAREPQTGSIIMDRDSLTNTGSLSAFVYLDKDGNMQFDDGDEPIENAIVMTPHNAGSGRTDEGGAAYISQLRPNLITDVYLDNGSLPDPYWISAREGVSISPKTAANTSLEFPVHIAGEIDGTVYKRSVTGSKEAASKVQLALYDQNGKRIQKTTAGHDGFYIFSLVPPGTYFMIVESGKLDKGFTRPFPQRVEIGYDGTTLYGNDIFLNQGQSDVSMTILSSLGERYSDAPEDVSVVLNLGDYNSKLMMAYKWNRLIKKYGHYLSGTHLLANPSDSQADPRTGKHSLRVSLRGSSFASGYKRCRELVKRGHFCKVEILPPALASLN